GESSAELREMNPGVDPDRLITGTRLRLPAPAAQVLARRSPADDASASDGGASAYSVCNRPSLSVSVPTVERSGARTHVVAPGESLWAIAQRYQVSIQQIREENSIDGEVIRPGQSLRIPGGTVALASPLEHVVEPGDTLWEIAQRYGSSVEAIRSANGLGER